MSILNKLKVNSPLEFNECYETVTRMRDFWKRTYKLPIGYVRGEDAEGYPIVPKHSCESNDSYTQRLSFTKPKNIAGSIIEQFNSFVFGSEIDRTGVPEELLSNADLLGNSWRSVIKKALLDSQVAGYSILIPDTTAPAEPLTIQQATEAGVRPFVVSLPIETMIDWTEIKETLIECLIKFSDTLVRYYNSEFFVEIEVKKTNRNSYKVLSVSAPVVHGYDSIPVVLVHPRLWEYSQLSKLAEQQQVLINLESILQVELRNHTFSHFVFTGDFDEEVIKNAKIGQGRATLLSTNGGVTPTFSVLGGSDVSQAASLRESIRNEISDLYKTAGLAEPEAISSAPESGIAKLVGNFKTKAIVKSLADAAEEAENKLLKLIGVNIYIRYPEDYFKVTEDKVAKVETSEESLEDLES